MSKKSIQAVLSLDYSPCLKAGDSQFIESSLLQAYAWTGLIDSPWEEAASPAAKIFLAALTSRSWMAPHSGQFHSLTERGSLDTLNPQSLQRLLDGYHRSIPISDRPYQRDLYSSCRTNSDQLASEIDLARQWFFCMFFTDSVSTSIVWFSRMSRVDNLWRKSYLVSTILACNLATFSLAFALRLEPFCFRANLRWSLVSFFSFLRKTFESSIFSPVDSMAKWVSPKSIPICPAVCGNSSTVSSHNMDTKYRSALSLETVTLVTLPGTVRENLIASGSFIFASVREFPSHLKPLATYVAVCLPCLEWKVGYLVRLAKKLLNDVCKCCSDCWTGTDDTSLSHEYSGSCLSFVSIADVW